MPRKKKSEKYLYKNMVSMKVTDMELEILNRHAATAGLSRSAYLRELFLSNEIHVHYGIVADMKILRDILKEYGKIGSNLNQITRYFNTGGERSLAMEEEIRHCIADLFDLREEVLKLAGETDGNS